MGIKGPVIIYQLGVTKIFFTRMGMRGVKISFMIPLGVTDMIFISFAGFKML